MKQPVEIPFLDAYFVILFVAVIADVAAAIRHFCVYEVNLLTLLVSDPIVEHFRNKTLVVMWTCQSYLAFLDKDPRNAG